MLVPFDKGFSALKIIIVIIWPRYNRVFLLQDKFLNIYKK